MTITTPMKIARTMPRTTTKTVKNMEENTAKNTAKNMRVAHIFVVDLHIMTAVVIAVTQAIIAHHHQLQLQR